MTLPYAAAAHAGDLERDYIIAKYGDQPADGPNPARARVFSQYIVFGHGMPRIRSGSASAKHIGGIAPLYRTFERPVLALLGGFRH